MQKGSDRTRATAALLASMLIFGSVGVVRRFLPLSSAFVAFARGVLGAALICVFSLLRGRRLFRPLPRRTWILLFVSGAVMGANWILLFEAYNATTVATATLCYYMEPTIVLLLSPVFFRERLTGRKLVCAAVSAAGMALVSGVAGSGFTGGRGAALGLGAAALYAAVVILNKLAGTADAYEKTVIQLLGAAGVMLPYLLLTRDQSIFRLTPPALGWLAVIGLVHTGAAYVLYFGGVQRLSAQTVGLLSYLDPVSALFFAAAFLNEPLTLNSCVGAVLILGAAAAAELPAGARIPKRRNRSDETDPQ